MKTERGFGFVTFESIAEADAALEGGEHKLGEKEIEVKRAIANKYPARAPRTSDSSWPGPPPPTHYQSQFYPVYPVSIRLFSMLVNLMTNARS